MRTPGARAALIVVLVVIGLAGGGVVWFGEAHAAPTRARLDALDRALTVVLADLADIGSAQALYVAPGQAGGPWPARVTALLQRLSTDTEAVRASADDGAAQALIDAVARVSSTDTRVREQITKGEDLLATDLLSSGARDALGAVAGRAQEMLAASRDGRAASSRATQMQDAAALAAVAFSWLVGLTWLARPGDPREGAAAVGGDGHAPTRISETADAKAVAAVDLVDEGWAPARPLPVGTAAPAVPARAPAPSPAQPTIDIRAAADASAAIVAIADGAQLPTVLARAAAVLDAQGAILWLGAGEQLVAVASHGYDARMLARVGPLDRDAPNVTAEAWRDRVVRTVTAPSSAAPGAIAAPMLAHDGCRGVLALEVRHGREQDPAVQAVALMFATQLAGVVTGRPES